jgi:hypothetical protein
VLYTLARENLSRFLAVHTDWQGRLETKTLSTLPLTERQPLVSALLSDLTVFTSRDSETHSRLQRLREKTTIASKAQYRMQVRLAVVLRMRAILTSIKARVYLMQDNLTNQRKSYDGLKACEALSLGLTSGTRQTSIALESFPSYDDERHLAEKVLPGWLGIRFKQASAALRDKLNLKTGASMVQAVYPHSPAQQAGLEVGDIIVGPPDTPFVEPQQIREWVMTAAIGTPATLQIVRGDSSQIVTITPQRYPLKWPSLPGPPKVGSNMPRLPDLKPYAVS